MGRSRITRTFHNKPVYKPRRQIGKPIRTTPKLTKTTYTRGKRIDPRPINPEKSKPRGPEKVKNNPTQRGNLLPQAHAQEELPAGTRLTGYTKDHLDQSRATTPDGKDAGVIETVIRTKTGFRAFGPGSSGKGQKSISISKSIIKKEKVPWADEPINVQYGMNPYTPASDTEGRAMDKKSKAKAIRQQRDWHSPLTLFASGVGNQAHDIGGSVHGLATGQDYQVKSVLNRAVEHAFAGDWDSAGKVISDNPYRFAGNVATEAGLAIIPFGMVARGAGIAGKVGSAVSKSRKAIGKAKKQRKLMTARKKDNTRLFKERGYATGRESRTGVIPSNKKTSRFAGWVDGREFPYSIKSGDETLGWYKTRTEANKALKTQDFSKGFEGINKYMVDL